MLHSMLSYCWPGKCYPVSRTTVQPVHRCSLFVFCRNLLLGSLYKDLRSLSYTHPGVPVSNQAGTAHDSDEELELSSLPTTSARNTALRMLPSVPSANSITSLTSRIFVSPGGDSSFQSSLAQTGFSLCFEEYASPVVCICSHGCFIEAVSSFSLSCARL